jgi:hypothetical protein
MQGLLFVHISPDATCAAGAAGRMLIKTGIVKSAVGADRWLLEFNGKGYNFSNVFRSEQLEQFAFFNTPGARDAFIADLIASNIPQQGPTPSEIPLIVEPPVPAAAP